MHVVQLSPTYLATCETWGRRWFAGGVLAQTLLMVTQRYYWRLMLFRDYFDSNFVFDMHIELNLGGRPSFAD